MFTNALMRRKSASEDKSPPSKLICLLLSKVKVFTILIKGSFVCILMALNILILPQMDALFFIHLIDENNMQLKYNNYVTFDHFHGKAVNNLSKIKLYKYREKRNSCCSYI